MTRRLVISLAVATATVVALALAWSALEPGGDGDAGAPRLTAASGALKIENSKAGRAVFSAADLSPGGTASGKVRIANPNVIPFRMKVESDRPAPGPLGKAIELTITSGKQGKAKVYQGSMADFRTKGLGTFQPEEGRTYEFTAKLPRSAGNELQGQSTRVDLNWTATANAPPEECRLRAARARFFIFRSRPVIRLVTKYRAERAGELRVVFHERLRGDRLGRRLGQMNTEFRRSMDEWGMDRQRRRRSEAVVSRLRASRHGVIARLHVADAPGYCASRLNLVLSELRRVDRQFVWFQRGSFRTIR